jgi:hypothetical protein
MEERMVSPESTQRLLSSSRPAATDYVLWLISGSATKHPPRVLSVGLLSAIRSSGWRVNAERQHPSIADGVRGAGGGSPNVMVSA